MKAIILAAGRGSRLGELTDGRPKCLVELAGQPLLRRQIAALRDGGVERIAIVRGYRGEMLDGFGAAFFENPRWSQTNMVMSLAQAAPWLREGPCVVSYSDIFYPPDIVRELAAAPAAIAISYDVHWLDLWTRRFADPLSDAETFAVDGTGRVVEIGAKPRGLEEVKGQYMGLLRIAPEGWGWIEALLAEIGPEAADRLDMTGLLRRLVAAGRPVLGVPFSGVWGEVDSASDLAVYEGSSHEASRS
ncbi:MAG: phosphocholine cytidylyltransferase family protein [Alphaproteobacteria bacterium]|nr:phosphocholine cytidylyltransferase family protein [Alphaproteobacteria bacterium]